MPTTRGPRLYATETKKWRQDSSDVTGCVLHHHAKRGAEGGKDGRKTKNGTDRREDEPIVLSPLSLL